MKNTEFLHPAFAPHLLNPQGMEATNRLRWSFSVLLCRIEELLPAGRELSLVRTKLEEAAMFAIRGVALRAENQATVQQGQVSSYEEMIDRYDAELTGVRVALTKAGIPEVVDGKQLSQTQHTNPTLAAPEIPRFASVPELARRLYQTYAQHADWKDYLGQPLPTFDDMRDNTKAHWMHVAEALALYGARQETNAQRIAETARQ